MSVGVEVLAIVHFVISFFVTLFECRPIEFYWDKSIRRGTCIDQMSFYRWNGAINLVMDILVWSLTLPVIWRMNSSTRQKGSLTAIFLLGLLYVPPFLAFSGNLYLPHGLIFSDHHSACLASIIRVTALNKVNFNDETYTIVSASLWTIVEQSVGIICACLPTLRPLFSKFKKSSRAHALPDYNPWKCVPRRDQSMELRGLTTKAPGAPGGTLPMVPRAILRYQVIEQNFDERV